MTQGESALSEIRDKIDSLDVKIQQLLNERAALAEAVAKVKAGSAVKIRPAREAQILRRMIARHDGAFPKQNLIRIWREIFSAMLRLEGGFSLAALDNSNDPVCWDLARDQFGPYTPITRHQTPRRVIEAVMRGEATLGILTAPGGGQTEQADWWRSLAVGSAASAVQDTPKVVGVLPFAGAGNARTQGFSAMAIARLEPEPSGDDRTWLVLEVMGDISIESLRGRLTEVGFEGNFLDKQFDEGPPRRWAHLIDISGFIEKDDARLSKLEEGLGDEFSQAWIIGAYATPFEPSLLEISTKDDEAQKV